MTDNKTPAASTKPSNPSNPTNISKPNPTNPINPTNPTNPSNPPVSADPSVSANLSTHTKYPGSTKASAASSTPSAIPAVIPDPSLPPPMQKKIKFHSQNLKKSHQMFLSFVEAPIEPFIYYELKTPHINFFFNSNSSENAFEFVYVDQLAIGAGVKMSGVPSGGPVTWSPILRGQKATLNMQGHKMKINVENDTQNPKAVTFVNQAGNPRELSLGFVNNQVYTTIFLAHQSEGISYDDFQPHLRAYYTVLEPDLTHVRAIEFWDKDLHTLPDVVDIKLVEATDGKLNAVVS